MKWGETIVDATCPINWEHPLCQGIVGWWMAPPIPGWHGGVTLRDLVRGKNAPNDGTLTNMDPVTAWKTSERGPVLEFDGVNDTVVLSSAMNPAAITISALGITDTTGSEASYRCIAAKRLGSETNQASWAFDRQRSSDTGGMAECRFYFNTAGTFRIWRSSGLAHAKNTAECLSVAYDSTGAPDFRNGATSASSVSVLGSGNASLPSNATEGRIGSFNGAAGDDKSWQGQIPIVVMHSRRITTNEWFSLVDQFRTGFPDTLNHLSRRMTSLPPADVATPMADYYYRNLLAGAA